MRRVLPQLHLLDWIRGRSPRTSSVRPRTPRAAVSDPGLKQLWDAVQKEFFPERPDLQEYSVYWSTRRQKRVLASCNIRGKKISVARELQDPLFEEWLHPLLYHEMCHAFIGEGVPRSKGKRLWHGELFRSLEMRHPHIAALDAWIKSGGWRYAVRRDRSKRTK